LKEEIDKLKQDISLAKGKTNQAIQRKGMNSLNLREQRRRLLKGKGKLEIIEKRKRLKLYLENPVKEANIKRTNSIEHNKKLK